MSQWINLHALQWAYEQDVQDLGATGKAVLITLAMHANEAGYTWPGIRRIADIWGMDPETVRGKIRALVVRRTIYNTKKRRGATGQVSVYRLPKIAYGSGGKTRAFEKHGRGGTARDKRGIRGGKSAPNNRINNKEERKEITDYTTSGKSVPDTSGQAPAPSSSSFSFCNYQNQPVQTDVKCPEFAAWCRSKGGTPTETGFWKWLCGQKPHWRNKVKIMFEETGYELGGKFFMPQEANRLGRENPDLLTKFRKAVRRDDKIEIIRT